MKTKTIISSLLTGMCLFFAGCYPSEPGYLDEYDVVLTNHDPGFSFPGHKNYAMPDRIVKITGNVSTGTLPEYVGEPYASTIMNRIQANMAAKGYTLVSDTAQADLIILPSALEVTNISYYYDYYSYYWGWYYPSGGWYYPYYPYYSVTEYTTGSLIMNMISKNTSPVEDEVHVVWNGLVNGVLEGSASDVTYRIGQTIDQAFKQSPYLQQ